MESEDIHRRAYNAVFEHFNAVCPGEAAPVHWSEEYYDGLQNKVGGGKPKMRYYFGQWLVAPWHLQDTGGAQWAYCAASLFALAAEAEMCKRKPSCSMLLAGCRQGYI